MPRRTGVGIFRRLRSDFRSKGVAVRYGELAVRRIAHEIDVHDRRANLSVREAKVAQRLPATAFSPGKERLAIAVI